MRTMGVRAALAAFLITTVWVYGALACSVGGGYLAPSNYDLVQAADAIVLAEATAFRQTQSGGDPFGAAFTFRILEVLKGDFKDTTLQVPGFDQYQGGRLEGDFLQARPGAYSGACVAYDYQLGKKFVLFLDRNQSGVWVVSGPPFTRINEEVSGAEAAWVVAVRHYARIGALRNYESEKNALKSLDESARRGEDPRNFPRELIADLEKHFKTPSPSKSYADLMAMYSNPSPRDRQQILMAIAYGKHREAYPFMQDLLQSPDGVPYMPQITEYFVQTKDRAVVPRLVTRFLGTKDPQVRGPILGGLIRLAQAEELPLMLTVLDAANNDDASGMAHWFAQYPDERAADRFRRIVNGRYAGRWELTFDLAGLGDKEAFEWARGIIATDDKDRWMGFYTIARSPLPAADAVAKEIIQKNDPKDLTILVQGYEDSFNPNRWDRLRDVINLKDRHPEVDEWLRRTLDDMIHRGDQKAKDLESLLPPAPKER